MPKLMTSPTIEGTAALAKYGQNPILPAWPIRMFCGLPIRRCRRTGVAGGRQPEQIRTRIEVRAGEPGAEQRRHREDDDVVDQQCRQRAADAMVTASRRSGWPAWPAIQTAAAS